MSEIAYPGTDRYSMAELLAVEIARNLDVEDGKLGGVGVDSEIPAAACNLARLTVAPNMWFWGQVEYPHNMYDVQDLGMLGRRLGHVLGTEERPVLRPHRLDRGRLSELPELVDCRPLIGPV